MASSGLPHIFARLLLIRAEKASNTVVTCLHLLSIAANLKLLSKDLKSNPPLEPLTLTIATLDRITYSQVLL